MQIALSSTTQEIISKLDENDISSMSLEELAQYLAQKKEKDSKRQLLLESLKAELLRDLRHHIKSKQSLKKNKKKTSVFNQVLFSTTILAGILVYLAENLDSSLSLLVYAGLGGFVTLALGILFSLLSLLVFFAFDLKQISNSFGIEIKDVPHKIDCYLQQLEESRALLLAVSEKIQASDDPVELKQYISILNLIDQQFGQISIAQNKLEKSLNDPKMKTAKIITTATVGLFFAAGGYFTGEAVVLLVAGLVTTAVPATWLVIAAGLAIGLCAYYLYFRTEGSSVKNWLGSRFGLDKEKIDQLSDKKAFKQDKGLLKTTQALLQKKLPEDQPDERLGASNRRGAHAGRSRADLSKNRLFSVNESPCHDDDDDARQRLSLRSSG